MGIIKLNMNDIIEIDGSFGEGGGQILRTSMTLSLVTGKPFRITNIRAGRKKPGILHQHLTAVNAAATISQAELKGNDIGSQELYFAPNKVKFGRYYFAVGTAGSCALVLQTVLPALITTPDKSELILEGGTHNPFAPPYDFLAKAFLPVLNRMGPRISTKLKRPGFYPAGGGKFVALIEPAEKLSQIDLLHRGQIRRIRVRAIVAKLPRSIAERELKIIHERLLFDTQCLHVEEILNPRGPGNALIVELECEHITEIFTGFGMRGVRAEQVAERTAKEVQEYLASDVPVGRHLADQLLIPMALAGAGKFRTLSLTNHSKTNIEVLKQFLDVKITVAQIDRNVCKVEIRNA
jgi:RNA 3'-terminal phosphate cyclase (ATP)